MTPTDVELNLQGLVEGLNRVQQNVNQLGDQFSTLAGVPTTEPAGALGAPWLDGTGNPTYIPNPGHSGDWIKNTSTPNPNYWLQKNYLGQDEAGIFPVTVVRVMLGSGANRDYGDLTIVLGAYVKTPGTDGEADTIRTVTVNYNLTNADYGQGYCDISMPRADIKVNDVVSELIVAAYNSQQYAESVYGLTDRQYTAGFGPNPPEVPSQQWVRKGPNHIKVRLRIANAYDTTEPYTGPACDNYYKECELWTHGTISDGWDGTSAYPTDPNATGWQQEPSKNIRALIRHERYCTLHGGTNTIKKDFTLTAHRKNSEQIWMAWRIVDTLGQYGNFANLSGSTEGPQTITIGTVTYQAHDNPGTIGQEYQVEVPLTWTYPVGLDTGVMVNQVIQIQTRKHGSSDAWSKTVENAPDGTQALTVTLKKLYKMGTSLDMIATITCMGSSANTGTQTVGPVNGGAAPTPGTPVISSVTHTKIATVIDVTEPTGTTNTTGIGVLQLFVAPSGTVSNPDTAPTVWKKLWHGEVNDDIAAGRYLIEATINRPNASRKAIIARNRSLYDATVYSAWSTIADAGTPPATDDVAPTNVSITSVNFAADTMPGAPGKWYDASVAVRWDGAADRAIVKWQVVGGATRHQNWRPSSAAGSTGNTYTITIPHRFKKGATVNVWIEVLSGTAGSGFIAGSGNAYTVGGAIATITGTITLNRTETKLNRNLYTAAWSGLSITAADLRWLNIFKGGAYWKRIPLSQPGADGQQTCTISTIDFDVTHAYGASIAVAIELEDCHGQLSASINDSGAAPPGSDDTAPALPTFSNIYSRVKDLSGTAREECDLSIDVAYDTNTGQIHIEVKDPDGIQTRVFEARGTTSPKTFYWRHAFDRGVTLYYRAKAVNGTAESAWTTVDASWPASAPSIVAGSTTGAQSAAPLTPVITRLKKGDYHDKFRLDPNAGDSAATIKTLRTIEIFSAAGLAAHGTFNTWALTTGYTGHATETTGDSIVWGATTYQYYRCLSTHTSTANDEPGVGVNWATYWEVRSSPDGPALTAWSAEPDKDISTGAKEGKKWWIIKQEKNYQENIAVAMRCWDKYARGTPWAYFNASGATPLTVAFGTVAYSGLSVDFGTITPTGGTANYTYDLDWGDGTAHGSHAAAASWDPASHTYAAAGSYICLLTVTDSATPVSVTTAQFIATVPVGGTAPIPTLTASATSGTAPFSPTLTVGASGGSGSGYVYDLDYGDGTTHGTASGAHTYSAAGIYTAVLKVTDSLLAVGTAYLTIVVTNAGGTAGVAVSSNGSHANSGAGDAWSTGATPAVSLTNGNGYASKFLDKTGFGFTTTPGSAEYIPASATPLGWVAVVRAHKSNTQATSEASVFLLKGGTASGDDMIGNLGGAIKTAAKDFTFGVQSSLNGSSVNVSDIVASNFGFEYSVQGVGATTITIDSITLYVYYSY